MDHPFDNLGDYGNGFLWSAVLCYREGRDQITDDYQAGHIGTYRRYPEELSCWQKVSVDWDMHELSRKRNAKASEPRPISARKGLKCTFCIIKCS